MTGDVVVEHLSFGYAGEQVVKDVSLKIPGGTTLGILGTTGSGKSTLMYLLEGLYSPLEGRISVGGVDLQDISLPWLRRHVGLVLQEPFLFSKTLEENISIAKDAGHEKVVEAVQIASLTESVERFAKGYDTMVGERGVTLSGGQKQRVAIARMLLEDAPIMILDDSLSAVDAETDEKIRHALKEVMAGRTVILISHRISTLMEADQVVVMEGGRITQRGTHEELIRERGLYKQIYEIQHPDTDPYGKDCVLGGEA